MKDHPRHRKIRDLHLRQGLAEVFTPGRHYPTYLAEKVAIFSKLRGDDLGRLQRLAIHRIHTERVFDLGDAATEFADRDVLTAYFQFFDELFFFGSLGGSKRCLLHPDVPRSEDDRQRGKFARYTRRAEDRTREQVYAITIFRQTDGARYLRFRSFLCFLLQAMCHAFLGLWRCKSGSCDDIWGERGAGYAWQEMALAVEDAVSDSQFLNLHIPLERTEMLIESLQAHPTVITDERLRQWRIQPQDVARFMNKG